MPEITAAPRPRHWPRIVGWLVLAFILLLVILYFVVSSSAFFKGVILPRVGKSLNANVTVADASIHPFSGVVLRELKVQTTGPEPLLTAREVRVAYHLGDILRGNYHVEEMAAISPVVEIITNPDGTSNLDPITKNKKPQPQAPARVAKPAQPSKPSAPARIDLNQLVLTNATIRLIKNYAGGQRDLTELSNVKLTLNHLANGQNGRLALAGNIAVDNHPPAPGSNATLQATVAGNFNFALSQDLKPVTVTGNTRLDIQQAGGSMSEVAGLAAVLDCDVSPTNIKQVALRFQKNGDNLGGLRLGGPFDMAKTEGRLNLEITPIDRQVLNLLGTKSGIDFGSTKLSSTNELDFAKGGTVVTIAGQFNAVQMTLTRQNETTPALDVHSDYQVTVNRQDNSAVLQKLDLNGTQNQQPLLQAELTSPMNFSWGAGGNAVGDSTLKLTVTGFNVADWKPFLGGAASSGMMNLTMNLLSQQGGKQFTLEFNSQLANLTAKFGANQLQQASLNLQGRLVEQQATRDIAGNLKLANLNGRYENYNFQNFGTTVDLDVALNKPLLEIKNIAGNIYQGTEPGGQFQLSGNYNQDDKSGQLALKLVNLNQNALRPFLGALLGDKQLVSVSVNSTTTANYAAHGESSLKTELQFANLVVKDPTSQEPPSPLEARMQLDASLNKQIARVRQFLIALTPTPRATNNQVTLTGEVDLSQTNAIQGSLKLSANTLDVTRYYDIYSKKTKSAKAPSPATPSPAAQPTQPTQAAANTEPPAKSLPVKNFTLDADIGQFFLREVEADSFQTTARIDNNRVLLKPFQFSLNGGPVNATIDLDLGVPGYRYDIVFSGEKIPVAPLADTFSPQYSGHAKGDLFANLQLKGAGATGASLQKNLSGQFSFVFTNANIEIVGAKIRTIFTPIALALQLPELLQSPITWLNVNATIGNGVINLTQFKAVGSAFSASSQGTATIADVLANSPINNLPVDLALAAPLAAKARLTPANAGTNTAYVELGKIATVTGTIGDPKTKVDKAAILLLTTRAIGGAVGGPAGNLLRGLGNLGGILNGQGQTNTSQPAPGQPATNRPGANPFDLLRKVLPK